MTTRSLFRWATFWGILALVASVLAFLWLSPAVNVAFQKPVSIMVGIAGGALLLLWLLLLSGFNLSTRLAGATPPIALAVLGLSLFRLDGCVGNNMPQLRWRFDPVPDTVLPALVSNGAPVDLRSTSTHDFPRFLGPQGDTTVRGVALVRDWKNQPPKLLWKQPIGAGWSSYSIVGPYAVTQEQRGNKEIIACYEVTTGKVRWAHEDEVRFSEQMGGDGPRATPTIADGKVYYMGATGIFRCLDGANGMPLWTHDVVAESNSKNPQWGKSCSPLVYDNLVVVTLGDTEDRPLAAYEQATGNLVWRSGTDKPSYASPVLCTLAGIRQVVSINAHSVTGHDPADGRELWRFKWAGEMARCSQPVAVDGERVYISAGYNLGSTMLAVKANEGGKLQASQLWKKTRVMNTRFTNVAVRDGYAYGLGDGVLTCQDLKDGEEVWTGADYEQGQILLVDDLLIVIGEQGQLALVEANPKEPRELGRIQAIEGKTWNNPAFSSPYLLVRNATEAACYELPVVAPPVEAVAK